MSQPVDKEWFWRQRLERAKREEYLHHSVYLAHPTKWEEICAAHETIIRRECAGQSVLDAGCGYGRMSQWCTGQYFGVDFSPDFIDEAKRLYPGRQFEVGDLANLPFANAIFDVAVCISIKHMIVVNLGTEAWEVMERELLRVARRVLLLEYTDPDKYDILIANDR